MALNSAQIFSISEQAHKKAVEAKVRISFQYIDWSTDSFFAHGLNAEYYHKLFSAFHALKLASVDEIRKQTHPSLQIKSIRWKKSAKHITQDSFPDSVMESLKRSLLHQAQTMIDASLQADDLIRDSFEFSLSKNYGRVHGFLFGDTFHIVWFDPGHNLFPGMTKGGKKKRVTSVEHVRQVQSCSPEAVNELRNENDVLRQELDECLTLLNEATEPQF
ncbi:MAG: hypothetical protein AUK35_06315 [Zetaproteobacteria bacterium CG2_30_46_52]|nr:MAG: hypothetical protein AUK35_06315 [Zetaproteobacteria bacterium CG2_30_46_52]